MTEILRWKEMKKPKLEALPLSSLLIKFYSYSSPLNNGVFFENFA